MEDSTNLGAQFGYKVHAGIKTRLIGTELDSVESQISTQIKRETACSSSIYERESTCEWSGKKKVGAQCMFEMTERRANSKSCMFFVVVVIVVFVVVVVLYSV